MRPIRVDFGANGTYCIDHILIGHSWRELAMQAKAASKTAAHAIPRGNGLGPAAIARELGMARSSVYRLLEETS
jgi:hypothetical protein